jgi:hypothetical protein
MKRPTREQQRYLVRLWDKVGPELERIRREELRGRPYDWEDVDALLELGAVYDGPPRASNGLVELQRRFIAIARKQGLWPVVKEPPAAYGTGGKAAVLKGKTKAAKGAK